MEFVIIVVGLLLIIIMVLKQNRSRQQELEKQLQTVRYEFTTRVAKLELSQYQQQPGVEVVRFDLSGRDVQNAFTGSGARAWDYIDHRFADGTGTGSHHISGNQISIERTNKKGRYELQLKQYYFDSAREMIPADSALSKRHLRITAEVKKEGSSQILRFVFKGESQNVLDEKDYVVFSPDWEPIELVFTIHSNESSYLRIDSLSVLNVPGTVHIRNLKLLEKQQA